MRAPRTVSGSVPSILSKVLGVAAAVCLLFGGVGLYVKDELVDERAFADRAAAALKDDDVQEVLAEEIVDALVNEASADFLVVRPLLETAVAAVVGTPQFRTLFELALRDAHGVLLGTDDSSVIVELERAGTLLIDALRGVSPDIAKRVPENITPQLARLDVGDAKLDGAQTLRDVGDASTWFLLAALLLAIGSVALAANRRRALSQLGIGVAVVGLLTAGLVTVGGRIVSDQADAATDDQVTFAIGALWERLFGDLRDVSVTVAVIGIAFAAVGGGILKAGGLKEVRDQMRAFLRAPSRWAQAGRGAVALVFGLALVADPALALRIVVWVLAALLLFVGAAEVTAAIARERGKRLRAARDRSPIVGQVAVAAGCLVLLAGAGFAAVRFLEPPEGVEARAIVAGEGCNGSQQLCNKRLNEVAFPATHNSFSAAEQPGWLFANQRFGIRRQLEDGIRGLLIDVHYGVRDRQTGRVRTDLEAEGTSRNRVAKALSPEALDVADRLVGRVGLGEIEGKRELYLCHTLCELGYRGFEEELRVIKRFLDEHENEVVILFVEQYVETDEIRGALENAGLFERVAELQRDEPLPALGELLDDDKQIVILTESLDVRSWFLDGFSFVQDTPLGARKPGEFSCDRFRGTEDSPMLGLNHWIDRFPPQPSLNREVAGEFLEARARECAEQRELMPGLLAVDFYDRSGVVQAAASINSAPPPLPGQ
jgi:uncharacterized membrane protein HdeD (DUF308 family)